MCWVCRWRGRRNQGQSRLRLSPAVQPLASFSLKCSCYYTCCKTEQPARRLPFPLWLVFWKSQPRRTEGKLSFQACPLAYLRVVTGSFLLSEESLSSSLVVFIAADSPSLLLDSLVFLKVRKFASAELATSTEVSSWSTLIMLKLGAGCLTLYSVLMFTFWNKIPPEL